MRRHYWCQPCNWFISSNFHVVTVACCCVAVVRGHVIVEGQGHVVGDVAQGQDDGHIQGKFHTPCIISAMFVRQRTGAKL